MGRLLVVLLLALTGCATPLAPKLPREAMRVQAGPDVVYLYRDLCHLPAVYAYTPEEFRPMLREGRAELGEHERKPLCWMLRNDGIVLLLYEDDSWGQIPMNWFVPAVDQG